MADSFTPNLNLRKPEVGAAYDTWGGVAGLNADLDLIDAIFLATGLGTSVGLHVGTGKVLNIEGQAQFKDATDNTKVGLFDSSLISTATTRTLKFPDENGTIATQVDILARVPTGTVFSGYYGGTPPPSFVMADGRTIGDATSTATSRANADTVNLFTLLWTITTNAQCAVSGGRGASAAADYAAHKTLALPNHSGRGMSGRDDLSGAASGVWPGATVRAAVGGAVSATATTTTSSSGVNNLNYGNVNFNQTYGAITSGSASAGGNAGGSQYAYINDTVAVQGYTGINANFTIGVSGTGTSSAFNIVQPTIVVDVIIAL